MESARRPPETRYAKSGDIHIAYQVIGNGPLNLVFVPGFVSHIDTQRGGRAARSRGGARHSRADDRAAARGAAGRQLHG